MYRIGLSVLFFISLCCALTAQVRETLYTTFPAEGIAAITHSLPGNIILTPWAGNQIMVEMTVLIENGTQRLLEHFIENDRYELNLINEGATARIFMTHHLPEYIMASGRTMYERVEAVIYYPEGLVNLLAAQQSFDPDSLLYEQDSIR